MVYKKDKRLLEFDEEVNSVDKKIEEKSSEKVTNSSKNILDVFDENELDIFDESEDGNKATSLDKNKLNIFDEDIDEDELNSVDKHNDEDAGFELDDSGMIPMLEELKALGNDEDDDTEENNQIEEFFSKEEEDSLNIDIKDIETTKKLEVMLGDDEILEENDRVNEESKYKTEEDDYESMYDFNYIDQLDDSLDIDKHKVFAEDDFLTDSSSLKVNFYDDIKANDNIKKVDNLDSKSELLEELGEISDNIETLDIIEEATDDFQDYLKAVKRIANSLERIADSLEKEEK